MHGRLNGKDLDYAALTASLAVLSLSMLLRSPFLFAFGCLPSALFSQRAFLSDKKDVNGDAEMRQVLSYVSHRYGTDRNLVRALSGIQDHYDSGVAKSIAIAVREYTAGIDPVRAFATVPGAPDCLGDFYVAIVSGLVTGTDITVQLDAIMKRLDNDRAYALKGLGSVKNSLTVSRLGGVLFFPMFSGMSIGIVNVSGAIYSTAAATTASLTALFAAYIVFINYLGFRYERSGNAFERIAKAAVFGTIGIGVFEASCMLSNLII